MCHCTLTNLQSFFCGTETISLLFKSLCFEICQLIINADLNCKLWLTNVVCILFFVSDFHYFLLLPCHQKHDGHWEDLRHIPVVVRFISLHFQFQEVLVILLLLCPGLAINELSLILEWTPDSIVGLIRKCHISCKKAETFLAPSCPSIMIDVVTCIKLIPSPQEILSTHGCCVVTQKEQKWTCIPQWLWQPFWCRNWLGNKRSLEQVKIGSKVFDRTSLQFFSPLA